jgi:hypothetical protein
MVLTTPVRRGPGECCENRIVSLFYNPANPAASILGGMMRIATLFLLLGATLSAQTARHSIADLSWLAGSWSGEAGGIQMEEHWTAPDGGTMVGMHRDVGKGRTMLFEFLRIEQKGDQIVYLSMPNGRSPATAFPLKELSGTRVVFENPSHDFPQRIIYWKDGADLRARIEGTIGGKAGSEEWRWGPGSLR